MELMLKRNTKRKRKKEEEGILGKKYNHPKLQSCSERLGH